MTRRVGVAALILALCSIPGSALAEPKDTAHVKHPPLAQALKGDARVLYDSARDLFKNGDYASAYAKFQRAFELSADPRLYWNMAACERKSKHNANVLRLIDSYLREGEGWLTEDDTREAARAAAAVRAFVASATLKTDPPDGVEVFVDDVRVATTPVEKSIWVDIGTRRVRFSKNGFKTVERSEEVPASAELAWTVTLEANTVTTPPPPPITPSAPPAKPPAPIDSPSSPSSPSRTAPLVVGGIGLAVAAAGGVLVYLTTQKFSDLRDECGTSCERSQWEDSRTQQIIGDALLIGGGVAVATGIVWLLALPSGKSDSRAWLSPTPTGMRLAF